MGDRSNVFIQMNRPNESRGWEGIGLYMHWAGESGQEAALAAARQSVARLGDEGYFARRVIHLTLNDINPEATETGAGLWIDGVPDNEHPVLVINALSGHYWFCDESRFREHEPGDLNILSLHP